MDAIAQSRSICRSTPFRTDADEVISNMYNVLSAKNTTTTDISKVLLNIFRGSFNLLNGGSDKSSQLPGKLQEAIVIYIMSKKDAHDLTISQYDLNAALKDLALDSPENMNAAMSLLVTGLMFYNAAVMQVAVNLFPAPDAQTVIDAMYQLSSFQDTPCVTIHKILFTGIIDNFDTLIQSRTPSEVSSQMPVKLQEAIMMLICSIKGKPAVAVISQHDINDELDELENFLPEHKAAIQEWRKNNIESLLKEGVDSAKQHQRQIVLNVAVHEAPANGFECLQAIPDDLIRHISTFLPIRQKLIFSETCARHNTIWTDYFWSHAIKNSDPAVIELKALEKTAKFIFQQNQQYRLDQYTDTAYLKSRGLEVGPNTKQKVRTGEWSIDEALKWQAEMLEQVKKKFPQQYDDTVNYNRRPLSWFIKYVIDGSMKLTDFDTLRNKPMKLSNLSASGVQKCCDNGMLTLTEALDLSDIQICYLRNKAVENYITHLFTQCNIARPVSYFFNLSDKLAHLAKFHQRTGQWAEALKDNWIRGKIETGALTLDLLLTLSDKQLTSLRNREVQHYLGNYNLVQTIREFFKLSDEDQQSKIAGIGN